ncbi:unnamed protein product, partial [Echinostoma caproni]|uniref:DUF3535 domain-containing protein n=1 Tax=Echinostoma caproni TaxID=27848 RepID=A0A183AI13_9TREM
MFGYPPVQRQELNRRLGLDDDNVVNSVLATHANVSLNHWIGSDDLEDQTPSRSGPICQLDVATCVQTAYTSRNAKVGKRSAPPSPGQSGADQPRVKQPRAEVAAPSDEDSLDACPSWPLDRICTNLLGDLWALRWETRHGAASGLRELLSEPRHTWQAGKCAGMSEKEMIQSNSRYLEDILVRVLCTLALDQLSDFVSDEVVAPVRETAAQLLGVLSRHLSEERVLLDLRFVLLPLVTPCLVAQLEGHSASSSIEPHSLGESRNSTHSVADEDIRAAAASALIPVVDADWLSTLGCPRVRQLIDNIWHLLRDSTTDLSPSTGPLLQLICALTKAHTEITLRRKPDTMKEEEQSHDSFCIEEIVYACAYLLTYGEPRYETSRAQFPFGLLVQKEALRALRQIQLPAELLQLVIDQLFHRILLETSTSVRSLATKICIDVIESAELVQCTRACVDRLDFWLCQAMQPVGVPFPPHLFTALVPAHPTIPVEQPKSTASPDGVDSVNPSEAVPDAQSVPNGAPPDPALHVHEHGYCIGGSHSVSSNGPTQQEAFVWETRIHAVRVLARLFARVCQCTQIGMPSGKVTISDKPVDSGPVSSAVYLLPFFLDQLMCCLHLHERLAMQRFIGGLVLSSWALLPSNSKIDSTWASVLADTSPNVSDSQSVVSLPAKLRARLESCLTEVIYYEEILGVFKLMQEDCRELICTLQSLGIGEDPIFTFRGVRTIAQCLTMLDKASKQLDDLAPDTTGAADPEAYRTAVYKLDRARSTVERCLALQLHWGSWVEFAIASALTNLNWLLPGRLSLLIRPFMDTIRCICPTPTTGELQSSKNVELMLTVQMPPTGSILALQRLATACLARLLQL